MKKEDFKKITIEYIETAKRIIEDNGACERICCHECPFYADNSENNFECEGVYSTFGVDPMDNDIKLLQSAKEFIKLFENDFKRTVDFVEIDETTKESIKIELKSVREELSTLFKRNRNITLVLTRIDEAIMWLEKDISEDNKKEKL